MPLPVLYRSAGAGRLVRLAAGAALAILVGCGGGGDGSVTPPVTGGIAIGGAATGGTGAVPIPIGGATVSTSVAFTRSGPILVNTSVVGEQIAPDVAALPGGGHVVVWSSTPSEVSQAGRGPLREIRLQRFEAAGGQAGVETLVASQPWVSALRPAVAGLNDGGYVVAWPSPDPASGPLDFLVNYNVQRYDRAGRPVGGPVRVNSTSGWHLQTVDVAALADGGFVVCWGAVPMSADPRSSSFVFTQRFAADSSAVGGQTRVAAPDTASAPGMALASAGLADGGWAIAWTASSVLSPADGTDIQLQQFDRNGAAVSLPIRVNTLGAGPQDAPAIAPLQGGGYAVSWTSGSGAKQQLGLQLFDAAGRRVSGEIARPVAQGTETARSQLASLGAHGFVLSWQVASNANQLYQRTLQAQAFRLDGTPEGDALVVGTTSLQGSDTGERHALAPLGDGGFVVAMQRHDIAAGWDVFVERFVRNARR